MMRQDIIGMSVVVLALATIVCIGWYNSDKSMREYDNRVVTCQVIAKRANLTDTNDYQYFMLDCIQSY